MTVPFRKQRAVLSATLKTSSGSTEKAILELHKRMTCDVPAYKKFLAKNGLRPTSSAKNIAQIPILDKKNYLRVFPYRELFWNGSVATPHTMTSTSGSTGDPFYFARNKRVDDQSAYIHEQFFLRSSLDSTKPTLVVVCFGMGVWIGGVLTYEAFQLANRRGYPFSIVTPGINKAEILKALRLLAPNYEQVILAGYPPFIKDVIDEALEQQIPLKQYRVGIIFAAEAFTEQFRDYICARAGIRNPLTDTINIYGSADLGTMAFETPLSIFIRRLATSNPAFFAELFGDIAKTPTLAQFIPSFTSFEEVEGQVVVSADSAMPLVRYAIGDQGGVREFRDIEVLARKHGISLKAEMAAAGIARSFIKLPFVFVYERSDLSTTLYGLQVYPETIREVLLREEYAPAITGRFALVTKFDEKQDQYLEINIEQRKDIEATKEFSKRLLSEIVQNLNLKNSEYSELSKYLGERADPHLVFWPHEDPTYFRRDIKQRWAVKAPKV